jgi:hypothetical protein
LLRRRAGEFVKRSLPRTVEGHTVAEAAPAPGAAPPSRAAEFEPDPVIEAYKRHVDRTLLRQNLRRSVTERVANLMALQRLAVEARRAGRARGRDS